MSQVVHDVFFVFSFTVEQFLAFGERGES